MVGKGKREGRGGMGRDEDEDGGYCGCKEGWETILWGLIDIG